MKKTTYFYFFVREGEILEFPKCIAKRDISLLPDICPDLTFLTLNNRGKITLKTFMTLHEEGWVLLPSDIIADHVFVIPDKGAVAWDNPDKIY